MKVLVGLGTCGIAAGAEHTYQALLAERDSGKVPFVLEKTGCIGMCYREPLVEVHTDDGQRFQYGGVTAEKVGRLLS